LKTLCAHASRLDSLLQMQERVIHSSVNVPVVVSVRKSLLCVSSAVPKLVKLGSTPSTATNRHHWLLQSQRLHYTTHTSQQVCSTLHTMLLI
jgi:hypothetical protein